MRVRCEVMVQAEDGSGTVVVGPGEVPEWAARQIDNPRVIADDDEQLSDAAQSDADESSASNDESDTGDASAVQVTPIVADELADKSKAELVEIAQVLDADGALSRMSKQELIESIVAASQRSVEGEEVESES